MSLVGPTGLRQNRLCILKRIINASMQKPVKNSQFEDSFVNHLSVKLISSIIIMFYSLSVPSSVTLTRALIVQVFKC